jgi:tRNA 2-selenouridine synthase
MKEITYSESLEIPDTIYIDVRAPEEFALDHVAGAVNIPLFDDGERKEVGTIYRMTGRDDAIIRGTAIVGDKLPDLVGSFMQYRDRSIVLMCARGGMRSQSLASLLDSLGLSVYKLRDGYKGYRRHVAEQLASLSLPAPLFVLQGLTGAGKTEIIRKLPFAIDLEEMAGHRSSVFGGIGIAQKTQKRFERLLCDRIRELAGAPGIVIEGESRKIGNLHLPDSLHAIMKQSPTILIDTPLERRVDIIYNEYHRHCNDENIPDIVNGLTPKLGKKNADLLTGLYREGNVREFIRIMLEVYYDPLYRHTLDRKAHLAKIMNLDTDDTVKQVRELCEVRRS